MHASSSSIEQDTQPLLRDLRQRMPAAITFHALRDKARQADHPVVVTVSVPLQAIDPLAALEQLQAADTYGYYWEHPDQKLSLSAGHSLVELKASGPDRFASVQRQIDRWSSLHHGAGDTEHSRSGLHFVGGFSFFDQNESAPWQSFNAASMHIPAWLLIRDGQFGMLTVSLLVHPDDTENNFEKQIDERIEQLEPLSCLTEDDINIPHHGSNDELTLEILSDTEREYGRWTDMINRAKGEIQEGRFEKIVLARELRLEADRTIAPTRLLNRLRGRYPTCYTFMIQQPGGPAFLGSTPERLASVRRNWLLTEALAGSISRGETASQDAMLARRLMQSTKDRREHNFVVDALRKRLNPISHSLDIADQPDIRKLHNVQHLYTPVTARLQSNPALIKLIGQLHPTPAVGGFPEQATLPWIRQRESFERGWYAGPVGWINHRNDGEFNVAIRSGLLHEKTARFFAGCGIVADSDPEAEWEETKLKLIPMISALRHALD